MNDPIITEDGPGSEYHAQTGKMRVTMKCRACGYTCGAEWLAGATGELPPPELRDLAAWREAARRRDEEQKTERVKSLGRRDFAGHACAGAAPPQEPRPVETYNQGRSGADVLDAWERNHGAFIERPPNGSR